MNRQEYLTLILDHYDSFTYNLKQYLAEIGVKLVRVVRTSENLADVARLRPARIILSPGPGHPRDVFLFLEVILRFGYLIPILGVCFGHQAIACAIGACVERNLRVMHGKESLVFHGGDTLYAGVPNPFIAMRYHSLVVTREECQRTGLIVTATTEEGEVMGIRDPQYPNVVGVQFHPESIFTEHGKQILKNFCSF